MPILLKSIEFAICMVWPDELSAKKRHCGWWSDYTAGNGMAPQRESCAKPVISCGNMRNVACCDVRSRRTNLPAPNVRCTVTNPSCANVSVKWCGMPARGCCSDIRFWHCYMSWTEKESHLRKGTSPNEVIFSNRDFDRFLCHWNFLWPDDTNYVNSASYKKYAASREAASWWALEKGAVFPKLHVDLYKMEWKIPHISNEGYYLIIPL